MVIRFLIRCFIHALVNALFCPLGFSTAVEVQIQVNNKLSHATGDLYP